MRVFADIPNQAFYRAVQQYGFSIGRPVFTVQQQSITLINYCYFATIHN